MSNLIRAAAVSLLAALVLASPAAADRAGSAPVRYPSVVASFHVAFTLRGDTWAQLRSGSTGIPAYGSYALAPGPVPPTSVSGRLCLTVGATVQRAKPVVRGKRLIPKPGSPTRSPLRIEDRGTNGPVQWWAGTTEGAPAAVGYQRAPKRLDSSGRRWLVYSAGVLPFSSVPSDPRARADAARTVRTVAATMRLRTGPSTVAPPFAGVGA